jgi:hypothetical protein
MYTQKNLSTLARNENKIKNRTPSIGEEKSRDGSVMAAEEHDDTSPDDVEPGLVLHQHPAEASSSRSIVIAMVDLHLVHP